MLAPFLAACLLVGPGSAQGARPMDAGAADTGMLVLGAGERHTVRVLDADGTLVATVVVRGDGVSLTLPPGEYALVAAEEADRERVRVRGGEQTVVALAGEAAEPPSRTASRDVRPGVESGRPAPASAVNDGPRWRRARGPSARTKGPRWTRWGAPLLSALVPGVGQAINRQGGKAVGVFVSTLALTGATVGVVLAGDRREGAAPGDEGDSDALEITRLGALSALTTALALLYVGQILDAHAVAAGKWPRPRRGYAVNLAVTRMSTVGMRPGQPAYALYDDISVSIMGQVAPNVAFGLSDASIKLDPDGDQHTVQAGLRSTWRFFERDRWWLLAGGGFIFQGTTADAPDPPLDPEAQTGDDERRFGAIPYVQLEVRWFLLDRWSLDLAPRLSVPLTDRDYRDGRRIPRFATTFELGAGVGVYF